MNADASFDANGNVVKEISGQAYQDAPGDNFDAKRRSASGKVYTYNRGNLVKTYNSAVGSKVGKPYVMKYNYDGLTRKKDDINAYGQVTSYYYDTDSNLTSITKRKSIHEPEVVLEKRVYNKAGDLIERYDALGNKTQYTYSQSGWLNTVTLPYKADKDKFVKKFAYNLQGQQTQMSDSMGKIQEVKYNEAGLVTEKVFKSTNGTEQITQKFAYDANGNKTLETDGKGNVTYINYDTLGRVTNITATDPKNSEAQLTLAAYDYDLNGNKLSEYNQYGNKTSYVYDALNRLIERIDAGGKRLEKLVYDNDYKQTQSIDALGNGVAYKYDLDGQLIGESKRTPENTLGNEAELKWNSQKYDLSGKLVEKTDRLGHKTKFNYDALDRLITVENALGEKTTYSYDLNGNLISQTDGNGNTTVIEYDEKGLMTRRIDPNGRTEKDGEYVYDPALTVSMTYNPDGTAKTMIDRNGNDFEYKYDALGRLVKTISGKEFVTSTYDSNGNVTKNANNNTEIMRLYDSFNRTVQKSVKGMGTSSFDYGDQGVKKPAGEGYTHKENTVDIKANTLSQTFDENGRLKAVEDGQDKTEYVYNDNGSKAQTLYPGGISTNYKYNPDNTVKSLTNQSASGVIDNYSYEYDDCGNMLRKTDSSGTTVYTYDPLNRIKTIVEPNKKTTEYEYDAAGNRIRERITGSSEIITKDYTYNSQNRLVEIVKHDLTGNVEEKQKFVYDNNGNQLYFKIELTERATEEAKPNFGMFISGESYSGESAKKFFESNSVNTYNVFNQLVKTTLGDTEVLHKYDPEGKRIEKTVVKAGKSKTIKYLRLGNEIAMEVDEKGDVISRNVNGTTPISRETDGNKYFLLYNGEGDVTALVDRTGKVTERYEYDAFGNVTKSIDGNGKSLGMSESKNPVRYRGYEYDEETKLYYLNARMYDPSTARFVQEDTYRGNLKDSLSLNLYTYCHNNPLIYIDPTGFLPTMSADGGGSSKKTKPTPVSKPTEQEKQNAKIKDSLVRTAMNLDKMNPNQIASNLTELGSYYANAKDATLKNQINSMADKLRLELAEDYKNNEVIKYFYENSNVKSTININGEILALNTESLKKVLSNSELLNGTIGGNTNNASTKKTTNDIPVSSQLATNMIVYLEKPLLAYVKLDSAIQKTGGRDFSDGLIDSGIENTSLLPVEDRKDTKAYKYGRITGDLASTILGAGAGITGTTTSIAVLPTVPVTGGASLVLSETALVTAGVGFTMSAYSASNLVDNFNDLSTTGNGLGSGLEGGSISSQLGNLHNKLDDLAETHLLPQFREIDPNLKAGYTGSFKTGVVGNPNKATFGQPIDLSKYDIDYYIESDILYEKFGNSLKANPEFRKILSETPGFEGLKPNKEGFSIKFKPSSK